MRQHSARWENGTIWTFSEFDVTERFKGSPPARIRVRSPGGRVGHVSTRVEEAPEFRPGDEAVLFLEAAADGSYGVTAWAEGTFRVRKASGASPELVTQDSSGIAVFDPVTRQFRNEGIRNLAWSEFQRRLAERVVAAWRQRLAVTRFARPREPSARDPGGRAALAARGRAKSGLRLYGELDRRGHAPARVRIGRHVLSTTDPLRRLHRRQHQPAVEHFPGHKPGNDPHRRSNAGGAAQRNRKHDCAIVRQLDQRFRQRAFRQFPRPDSSHIGCKMPAPPTDRTPSASTKAIRHSPPESWPSPGSPPPTPSASKPRRPVRPLPSWAKSSMPTSCCDHPIPP